MDHIVFLRPGFNHERERLDDLGIVLELEIEHVQKLEPALFEIPPLLVSEIDRIENRRDTLLELLQLVVDLCFQHIGGGARSLGDCEPAVEHRQGFFVTLLLRVQLSERQHRVLLQADRQISLLQDLLVGADRGVVVVRLEGEIRLEVVHLRHLVAIEIAHSGKLRDLVSRARQVAFFSALLRFREAGVDLLPHRGRAAGLLLLLLAAAGALRRGLLRDDERPARDEKLRRNYGKTKLTQDTVSSTHPVGGYSL